MSVRPTNDFNSLSLLPLGTLTGVQQHRLMMMALNGDSIVSPFTEMLDRQGLTRDGRSRKEREQEELRRFRTAMTELQERHERFQHELDRLEQASLAALQENEEQQRAAREELRKIQDHAYKITQADGTTARVYRDGDKVRYETGGEVSGDIVRAEDLGTAHSTWSEFTRADKRIEDLHARHDAITAYRKNLHEAQDAERSGKLNPDEIDALQRRFDETMPSEVRAHHNASSAESARKSADGGQPLPTEQDRLAQSFTGATNGAQQPVLSENDFEETTRPHPAASAHAKV